MQITVDPKLKALIPPLSQDEYDKLEENLIADGCRDPLVVWDGLLIDGHNRYEICQKHNIRFDTKDMMFKNHDEAKEWMLWNQLGRRNLTDYDRTVLALELEEIVKARAKENLVQSGKQYGKGSQKSENPIKPVDTMKEVAKVAGVSHDTVAKVKKIEEKATPEVKKALSEGKISINKAHQQVTGKVKKAKPLPEAPEYSKEEFERDQMMQSIEALQEENSELKARLAVEAMDASEEEKTATAEIIADLKAEIKTLKAENSALKSNRDSYQNENTQLKKQIKYLERELKKVK